MEVIAASGNIATVWYEYDAHNLLIEKILQLKHIFIWGSDNDFVHKNFELEERRSDEGLRKIAESVKKDLEINGQACTAGEG